MSTFSSFTSRLLSPAERAAAEAIAVRAGAHGVYVGNRLAGDRVSSESGCILGLYSDDALAGVAFFGERGNLILLQGGDLDPPAVADAVRDSGLAWRIVLGPESWVGALAAREAQEPLVHRRQLYYAVDAAAAVDLPASAAVRAAGRRDQSRLMQAALDLNLVDLCVDPARVHRAWLRDAIRRRVRAGQTFVMGEPGQPTCKLDIGSAGSFGVVIEGVYTFPEERGRGLATALVAGVARAADSPLVCLHVAESNRAARHAYESAGMRSHGVLGLLLRC